MTFEEARPIVERMLFEYALYRRRPPAPPVSGVYGGEGSVADRHAHRPSSVERYVLRHEDELRLEAALDRLAHLERQALALRYIEHGSVAYVAKRLNCGETFARRVIERALYAVAAHLGMLGDDLPAEADAQEVTV